MQYIPGNFEKKWQKYWEKQGVYKTDNHSQRPKYYVLDMFPYPSGSGLHVGHPLGYIASDIFARYKRLKGYNVLHPMGYDAFGLPAEQYALETGVHPAVSTDKNIATFKAQLQNIGFSYDWSRELKTSDPKFYKWTQWIFIRMYQHYYDSKANKAKPIAELIEHFEKYGTKNLHAHHSYEGSFTAKDWKTKTAKEKDDILMHFRLMYRKKSTVNWCEALGTVLANDEVKDGYSERGGHPVTKKSMKQWSMRTTAYAQRLLDGLKTLEWPKSLVTIQQNWIGKSEGAKIHFEIIDSKQKIAIYTTRPDTIFGATFIVLAPEHKLVNFITTPTQKQQVDQYQNFVCKRTERDRLSETHKVSGTFTGAFAKHPFTNEKLPIWISEYVLPDYGTGAIMAVPSSDLRDQAFAKHFDLPIVEIIDRSNHPNASIEDKEGTMINSEFLNGLSVNDAIQEVLRRIENSQIGVREVNFKLRDANYSRQRYWGEPFPIYYDKDGVSHALDEDQLPLVLPDIDDFKPGKDGNSPLARQTEWKYFAPGKSRETDTMPGFAGSSWYFLRYMDPQNEKHPVDPEILNYWKDVDLYVGGAEHAVGHLLYSRTWHKFLYDIGIAPTEEPFKKLINQGMIQGVIESIYLAKTKKNGQYHFLCANLVQTKKLEAQCIKIPVHIDFVKDYGSEQSHLDSEGIKAFTAWRPEYANALFESEQGLYPNNNSNKTDTSFRFFTKSETGKMSKRYFNVINPDDVVRKHGADAFRMYEMFLGPIEQSKPWDINKIDGVSKFLRKCWSLFFDPDGHFYLSDNEPNKNALKILHQTIQAVERDINKFSLNTCVSHLMICVNQLKKEAVTEKKILLPLLQLLAAFAPHMTEELWHLAGNTESIHHSEFPKFEQQYVQEEQISYPVCINGKKRAMLSVPTDYNNDAIQKEALKLEQIQKWVAEKTIRKIIIVPKKMINIVV